MNEQPWKLKDGRIIDLIPADEYDAVPDGTVLWSIQGERKVKGVDYIDGDTRFGYLAYGRVNADEALARITREGENDANG